MPSSVPATLGSQGQITPGMLREPAVERSSWEEADIETAELPE